MKILAVSQEYPSVQNKPVMAFVHSRNVHMKRLGHSVEVLSFAATSEYEWDGISVKPADKFDSQKLSEFDVCYFHAPNLRNCLRFFYNHRKSLNKICLVIHGHEFLDWTKYTPPEYPFMRTFRSELRRFAQSAYDKVKLRMWNWVLRTSFGDQIGIIFVSNWMKRHSEKCLGLSFDKLEIRNTVIENPIHPAFAVAQYKPSDEIYADFVTIRPFDQPKYCIDLVVEMAKRNPEKTFHIYGYGRYFEYFPAPQNVKVIERNFRQEELPELLNHYRCALLPTRVDAQGVLMCEAASLGMPILTSDLDICHEVLGDFTNAGFFSNDLLDIQEALPPVSSKPPSTRFFWQNTISKEIDFARGLPSMNPSLEFASAPAVTAASFGSRPSAAKAQATLDA